MNVDDESWHCGRSLEELKVHGDTNLLVVVEPWQVAQWEETGGHGGTIGRDSTNINRGLFQET